MGASGEEMPRKQIHHSPPARRQEQEETEEKKQGMEDGFKGVCVDEMEERTKLMQVIVMETAPMPPVIRGCFCISTANKLMVLKPRLNAAKRLYLS